MAIIWITHDLAVIAGMVDKVAVMYAGFIVEMAPVGELYKKTAHPYTLGLLESLPQIGVAEKKRLIAIEGLPPDLLMEPTFCPFAPRCRYVVDRCYQENPTMNVIAPDHYSACWRAEEVYDGLRILEYAREEVVEEVAA
jgi:oligopeptide transport system ATP-binding protein